MIMENISKESGSWGRAKWGYKNFFPVTTTDGEATGWYMGPSDGTEFKKKKICALDPTHEFLPHEVVLINYDKPGQEIAISSVYKAIEGDTALQEKMINQFNLPLNINVQ